MDRKTIKQYISLLLASTLLTACGVDDKPEAERKAEQGITSDGEPGQVPVILGDQSENHGGLLLHGLENDPELQSRVAEAKALIDAFKSAAEDVLKAGDHATDQQLKTMVKAMLLQRSAVELLNVEIADKVYAQAIQQYQVFDVRGDLKIAKDHNEPWGKLKKVAKNIDYFRRFPGKAIDRALESLPRESVIKLSDELRKQASLNERLDKIRKELEPELQKALAAFHEKKRQLLNEAKYRALLDGLQGDWDDDRVASQQETENLRLLETALTAAVNYRVGKHVKANPLYAANFMAALFPEINTKFVSCYSDLKDLNKVSKELLKELDAERVPSIADKSSINFHQHNLPNIMSTIIRDALIDQRSGDLLSRQGRLGSRDFCIKGDAIGKAKDEVYMLVSEREGTYSAQLMKVENDVYGPLYIVNRDTLPIPLDLGTAEALQTELYDAFVKTMRKSFRGYKIRTDLTYDPNDLVVKDQAGQAVSVLHVEGGGPRAYRLEFNPETKDIIHAYIEVDADGNPIIIDMDPFVGLFDFLDAPLPPPSSALSAGTIASLSGGLSRASRVGSGGLDLRSFSMNGHQGTQLNLGLPLFVQLKGSVDGGKSTDATTGSVAYRLGNTVIGAIQAYANSGESFGLDGRQLETSVVASHSFGGFFVEGQLGAVSANNVHTADWSGVRSQVTLGVDTQFVSPFIQVAHRQLDRNHTYALNDTAAYVGLDVEIAGLTMDAYRIDTRLLTKVGVGSKDWTHGSKAVGSTTGFEGSVEWSGSLTLNSGVSFSTNLTLGSTTESSASFTVSVTQ